MGVISILLGIISIIASLGAGALVGNAFIGFNSRLGSSFEALKINLSDGALLAIFILVFGFIGVLIGMNLIMHGLNYNKLEKIQKRIRHL